MNEMAEYLKCSPKTLNKYVKAYQIPFIGLGRNKRFNCDVVEKHLQTVEANAPVTMESKTPKRKFDIKDSSEKDFFRRELGLL